MISPRIRFDHLDPVEWQRLRRLLLPAPTGGRPPNAPLVLLLDGGVVAEALRLPLRAGEAPAFLDATDFTWAGPPSLPRLRAQAGARLAVAVEQELLVCLPERIDAQLSPTADLVAQCLTAARALRAEVGKSLHLDPDFLGTVPVPEFAAVQQTFDLLLPSGRSAGLFVFDRNRLYTSVLVEKHGGDLTRVTSHHALGSITVDGSVLAGGRHGAVLDAIGRRLAPPHAVVFCTLDALREIAGPQGGALARAVALRQAVVDPAPPWLVALAGAGAVAGVAQTAAKLFGRFVPQTFKDTVRDAARVLSPFAPLGFDPIALFTQLQKLLQS